MGTIDIKLAKTELLETLFDWPLPPFFQAPSGALHPGAEECELLFPDDTQASGHLRRFSPGDTSCQFLPQGSHTWCHVDFKSVKQFRLTRPLELVPDVRGAELVGGHAPTPGEGQTFALEYGDGKVFSGETAGHERTTQGLYLYPIVDENMVQRIFVPDVVIAGFNVGELIGELLIQEAAVSADQVQVALEEQAHLRTQRLGDLLVEGNVVTREELERALKHQESMPVMRLGQAIVQLGLASDEQIASALARQKSQRDVPLGQILIEMGVVNETQMKEVLAKKLGIPLVSLDRYPVDLNAVRLLDSAFAYRHMVLPLYSTAADIVIALEQPLEFEVLNQVRFLTGLRPVPVMATRDQLRQRINDCDSGRHDAHQGAGPNATGSARPAPAPGAAPPGGQQADELASRMFAEDRQQHEEHPDDDVVKDGDTVLVQFVNKMIGDAFDAGASDIHVETYPGRQNSRIRFRQDGVMRDYLQIPANFRAALISRIKIMASLDISERRRPQDGKLDFLLPSGCKLELRLATIPTSNGLEDAVMRLLAASTAVPIDQLNMDAAVCAQLKSLADKSFGLILVCGPTGSGKTTTLHSLLAHMNTSERKIWTAEDPIEITQPGLRQVQMQHKIGWDFAAALRAFMRADPDVIMVGEMRDAETARVGVEASLTGHVVLSTLHTNSAAESVTRLLDLGLEPFSFADALLGVLAQRLVRKLCTECKSEYVADETELAALAHEYCINTPDEASDRFNAWSQDGAVKLYRPVGCKNCDNTGYKGRIGIYELLVNNANLRQLIQKREPVATVITAAAEDGMHFLKQDGIDKVLAGITDIKQVRAVCN